MAGCLEGATYMALIIKKADTVLMMHIFCALCAAFCRVEASTNSVSVFSA